MFVEIIGCILIASIIAVFVSIYIWDSKKRIKTSEEGLLASEDEHFNKNGENITTHVEVLDMICGVSTIGYQAYKQPKSVKDFVIKFKTDTGDVFDVHISEEMYEGFDVGLSGMLTLVDGQISSFELDDSNN